MPLGDKPPVKRRIWRIIQGEPAGDYVDASTRRPPRPKAADERHPGWAVSSFELKYGLDVIESVTGPGELATLPRTGPPK